MRTTTSHSYAFGPRIATAACAAIFVASGCSGSSTSSGPGDIGGAQSAGGDTSLGGSGNASGGVMQTGGAPSTATTAPLGGSAPTGGASNAAGSKATGGATGGTSAAATNAGGTKATGGIAATGGSKANGGANATGGLTSTGGTMATVTTGGTKSTGGVPGVGGTPSTGGAPATGGSKATGGAPATGGSKATGGTTTSGCTSGPIGTFTGALATGITFTDTDGKPVNAHGGGIIKVGNTFYMHGEYFLSTTTNNDFNGFSMYSSQDMATWKNEGIILPQQASGQLGPNRKGERPHIIKCPATGEFVLYAHSADLTYQVDKEVVYATSTTVNGQYSFKGSLTNASGAIAAHGDMSALSDGNNAYVVTESGHVYTLSSDCHSWLSDNQYTAVNGDSGGSEAPTVFKAGSTYYWIGSYKTGWRANNNFYATAPAMTGKWTHQGFVAPVTDTSTAGEQLSDQRTWLSQTTWVQPVVGCQGTVYVFWGDHWYGDTDTTNPGKHNDQATYMFQPLVFNGTQISMPTYLSPWKLDVGLGTWSQ